ncbi:MAG TPA: response regulator [Cyclobacteriaceae bacterium]|nr:response regulator [Cyclobacteriaceae bacterium]
MALESVDLVVLIDDSDIDLFVQRRFIELSGFARRVLTFQSSREALKYLSSAGAKEDPDLIFLDLNMPEIDGFAFLEQYSRLVKEAHTRIIILTSSSSSLDRDRAATFGNVIGFLSKPLTEGNLSEIDIKGARKAQ